MLSNKIRRRFVQFFVENAHRHLPSSPVIPHNDPTLLFCNAGMNQFKSYFLGQEEPPVSRAVTSQKCIRVGGKHNDLENVGHTSRHLTFFEMLGNFSFGDYSKKEAIDFAWIVTNNILEIDTDLVWVSVYEDDEESYELWRKHLPAARIVYLGAQDNFWQMGDVGPCGPCSELLFDRGKSYGDAKTPQEDVSEERFFEFWNLVFMQYNKDKKGVFHPLPKPSVDTGMGLERIVSLKMDVQNVFETDILSQLIQQVESRFKLNYREQNEEHKAAFHVIVDHLRCLAFAIADGAQPSNIDRGYVLRKVLRRAVRYGRLLGAQKPFMAQFLPELIQTMGEDYPELVQSKDKIAEILTLEEETFLRTLKRGGNLLSSIIKKAEDSQSHIISGDDAFLLKDTYGLPIDEIKLMAKDKQLTVDVDRFGQLEKKAKEISKQVHQTQTVEISDKFYSKFLEDNPSSKFCGFKYSECEATVLGIIYNQDWVEEITAGQQAKIILDQTPFYAEKGGQVGDRGLLKNEAALFSVQDTQAPYTNIIVHDGSLKEGKIQIGDTITCEIDVPRRKKIQVNHTATHLLHWALQQVLGEHIKQAGSLVEAERFRFDFSHHKAVTSAQIREIENLINQKIQTNRALKSYELAYQEVQQIPEIKQFFGDKYGLTVRVVDIDFSKELCGGCHVEALGEIGLVRITKESSIAAGIRRLEAVSGQAAIESYRTFEDHLMQVAHSLKSPPLKAEEKLKQLQLDYKNAQEHLKTLAKERNSQWIKQAIRDQENINGIALVAKIASVPKKELRELALQLISQLKSGVCVICIAEDNHVQVVISVSPDWVKQKLSAKDLLMHAMVPIEGKGGGKADFAQAGGTHADQIPEVFNQVKQFLSQQ